VDLARAADLPSDVDILLTSRALHHLDRASLDAFYREAAKHLRPGGWLVNLDHIAPNEVWDRRLRAARQELVPTANEASHHHNLPLPSQQDHLDALAAAGLTDAEVAWRAFYTCLFVARKDG
jgi:SAM-dependent methyltransferase